MLLRHHPLAHTQKKKSSLCSADDVLEKPMPITAAGRRASAPRALLVAAESMVFATSRD